ncbi:hypothetical protein ACFT9M_12840 [Micromonospora purpureochromogenes]|uniref:hypothetical protein n=1 Tax=Micromonospora purpureochromogenes TaxID=47872 RepID=UPI003631FC73
MALRLIDQAQEHLIRLAGRTGCIPAAWLNERRVGVSDTWTGGLDLQPLQQIANAFAALIHDDLRTTATTSPVLPRPDPNSPDPAPTRLGGVAENRNVNLAGSRLSYSA